MIVLKAAQEKILAALQAVGGIVERRHTLPILANVLIRKQGPDVELITSDLEIQIRTTAQLDGDDGSYATTVGAKKLADILKSLPADQIVSLTAAQNRLTLQGGKSRFTLQTLPAEDFPLVQEAADFGPAFSVPQKTLKMLISQVHFAMAVHDIRYYLNGILFVAEGKTLTLVATDGHRLALSQATLDVEMPRQEVILPRKTVLELQRLLKDDSKVKEGEAEPVIEMRFAGNQAKFNFGGLEFVTKLVEGKFPDYNRVIPKNHKNHITVGRTALLASLQRAAILTSEKFKGVRMNFAPGLLSIASSNAEQEEAKEELEIDYGGDSFEIGFNVSYLMDVLANMSQDMVTVSLQDANSSALITNPEYEGFKYVVMPMRI
ncbi:DNA polymerase III subunit beta [Aquabacterium fontiphilum]|jgi:DNA polymerase-3 subunit beta|uniref:DNA polymerase III subunit beta n=1 Tax=Aquabacterium fontiphilum TaxID=450365 RepID=UPI0013776686|nr:DNA polymerase III subunit beta [Aquabacterium fontiphilum]NBD19115.1 DNA polymerase III subunit beta [Aquabacterium fontiphilum]